MINPSKAALTGVAAISLAAGSCTNTQNENVHADADNSTKFERRSLDLKSSSHVGMSGDLFLARAGQHDPGKTFAFEDQPGSSILPGGLYDDPIMGDFAREFGLSYQSLADCPETLKELENRVGKRFFSTKAAFDALNAGERHRCLEQGDHRASQRLQEWFQFLPSAYVKIQGLLRDYVGLREKLQVSQCEADLAPAIDGLSALEGDQSNLQLPTELFRWDVARLIKKEEFPAQLVRNWKSDIGNITITTSRDYTDEGVPILLMVTDGLQDIQDRAHWSMSRSPYKSKYGFFDPFFIEMPRFSVELRRPVLEPIDIIEVPTTVEFYRKHKTNLSSGDYRRDWRLPKSHKYCRNTYSVWSANNICSNSLSFESNTLTLEAELMSGSIVDKYNAWLRFRGKMVGISTSATRCQIQRAQCQSTPPTVRVATNDKNCGGGRSNFETVCAREGPISDEICHVGFYNDQGRCQVTKIIRCRDM